MTRDEVMKMTDEELRIKAAELRGWKAIGILNDGTPYGRPPAGWTPPIDDPNPCDSDNVWCLPDYPNDIAAAQELVECAIDNGFMMKLKAWSRSLGTVWDCTFDRSDMDANDSDEKAGRATTRAFILAMDAE